MKKIGLTVLAIWLILTGLLPLLNISFSGAGLVLNLLAVAAGVLLIWRPLPFSGNRKTGFLLLGIWLIFTGLVGLLSLSFRFSDLIHNLLAAAAGVFLLLEARG